jgi:flavin-dependent dehydrogenase
MRLKGIHLAMRTGMLAAETAFEAVRSDDTSTTGLAAYQDKLDRSAVKAELYPVRNVHQAFGYGLLAGLTFAGFNLLTGGRWPKHLDGVPGHARMQTIKAYYGAAATVSADGVTERGRPGRPPPHLRQAHERALLGHSPR